MCRSAQSRCSAVCRNEIQCLSDRLYAIARHVEGDIITQNSIAEARYEGIATDVLTRTMSLLDCCRKCDIIVFISATEVYKCSALANVLRVLKTSI